MTYTAGNQDELSSGNSALPWHVRAFLKAESRIRPYQGWGVLLILIVLAALPAFTLRVNNWVRLGSDQAVLEMVGPISVVTVWLVAGWRRPRRKGRHSVFRWLAMAVTVVAVGLLVITQATARWIPSIFDMAHAISAGTWNSPAAEAMAAWGRLGGRFGLWWAGVQAGTTAQDNLVFLVVSGTIVWIAGSLSAALARRFHNGLLASAPLLWLLGSILLYSREGRVVFVFALGLALVLHFLTDHEAMLKRWREHELDYSPGLFVDRLMLVLGAALLILTLAAVMPNLYVQALVNRYYAEMQPAYERLEETAERLFPGVKGTARLGGGLAGGLPNDFLLQAGPELTDALVMRVRTNDAVGYEYPYDTAPPPRHYMRGGTFASYDGRGWSNHMDTEREQVPANDAFRKSAPAGRKEVVQQVALAVNTQVLYGAPEPVEVSAGVRVEERSPGDVVAIWGREKSYTVVSLVPAVDEESLGSVNGWGSDNPLPEEYAIHLELPDTVTQRTVDLARRLTEDQPNMYAKAQSIEEYLREFEYDLGVEAPPPEVVDVADYFLFDLQRGYCDYYATSFVVLARAAGIPARFATGFAPGSWNPDEGLWTITEAQAHSWPEILFPEYGWIPFEPTAAQPELLRIGLATSTGAVGAQPRAQPGSDTETTIDWNWQMLFWLLPLALVAWGTWTLIIRVRRRNEDPWQTLVQWGGRAGRPMASGETILEYGESLADYVIVTQTQRQDLARIAASEMRELSGAISYGYYAPSPERERAEARAAQHWERLRSYLRVLRRGR